MQCLLSFSRALLWQPPPGAASIIETENEKQINVQCFIRSGIAFKLNYNIGEIYCPPLRRRTRWRVDSFWML